MFKNRLQSFVFGFIKFAFVILCLFPLHVNAQLNCQLPPPENVGAVTNTYAATVSWEAVPGAAAYRVIIYDQTIQTSVADAVVTTTSYTHNNMVDSHEYIASVSSSACTQGPFGAENNSGGFGVSDYIVVDDINMFNEPTGNPNVPFPTQLVLIRASSTSTEHEATHVKVVFLNGAFAQYLVWLDCTNQIRFFEIASQSLNRDPNTSGPTPKIRYLDGNIELHKLNTPSSGPNSSTVPLSYHPLRTAQVIVGKCRIQNDTKDCKTGGLAKPSSTWSDPQQVQIGNTGGYFEEANMGTAPFQHQFSATPNPFTAALQIQYASEVGTNATLTLTDATGRIAQSIQLPVAPTAGNSTLQLPTDHLPQGVYFLVFQTASKREVIKVIKSN